MTWKKGGVIRLCHARQKTGTAMVKEIKSRENPLYKKLISVGVAASARKHRLIAVEGLRHVKQVLEAGHSPELVFFSDDLRGQESLAELKGDLPEDGAERIILLPPALFDRASQQKTPQGVIGLFRYDLIGLEDLLQTIADPPSPCRLLMLENVQDPGNVGSLIRTADALGLDGVILAGQSASVWNPKTAAASMGSIFQIPLAEGKAGVRFMAQALKEAGFEVIGSGLQGVDLSHAGPFGPRVVLLLGNEGSGLTDEARKAADRILRIPMEGRAESFNVAAAGAILLWELAKDTLM